MGINLDACKVEHADSGNIGVRVDLLIAGSKAELTTAWS